MEAVVTDGQISKPLVSIVTGFYNRGHVLDMSVMSLLSQTYPNTEVIVFDDLSTDDTQVRLASLVKRFPALRVITHTENKGFTRGLIDAIELSRGEFIAIHGSGDISLPKRISRQVEAFQAHPDVGVVGCYYDNVIDESGIRRRRKIVADDVTTGALLRRNVFSHGEVMFRRSTYDSVGGYRSAFRFALDYDLWLRMAKVTRFFTVKEVLYERHVQADGVSYAPEKFLRQSRYILAARSMASSTDGESRGAYARLESDGLDAVVSPTDARLQPMIVAACLRSVVWGYQKEARTLAEHITAAAKRWFILGLSRLWTKRASSPVRAVVYRTLGIGRN